MAGTRLEKLGSIFSRIQGLLKSGALREVDKPLWYDVYAAFPPKIDPTYKRAAYHPKPIDIFYKEDTIRAEFYKVYGNPEPIRMGDKSTPSMSQRFIDKYQELKKSGISEANLFESTADTLRSEGFNLKSIQVLDKEKEEKLKQQAQEKLRKTTELKSFRVADVFGNNFAESSEAEDTLDETLIESDTKRN